MTIYTIENESNHIIRHVLQQDADVVTGAERFSSEADLATIAASWPTTRLVEIWNQLPGVTPVRKFTDRKTAVSRIWERGECHGGRSTGPSRTRDRSGSGC